MQIRAAVLEEFGKPLVVQEIGLDGPEAGEVLVRVQACGVCHTDMYTAQRRRSDGLRADGARARGRGRRRGDRRGRDLADAGRPRAHAVLAAVPRVHPLPSGKTNICLAIREQQGQGYLPDHTTRLSRGDEPIRHFMGTSTFAEATVMPEIALAKVAPGGAARRPLHARLRATTGIGAALYIGEGRAGHARSPCSARARRPRRRRGRRLAGAERDPGRRPLRAPARAARGQGATDELLGGDDVVEQILELTGGFGTDYTFEATGLVSVMRQAVEAARMGWGQCAIAGVAGKGETLNVIPRFLITGRRIAGASFGGAQRPRPRPGARAALPRRQAAARRVHLPPAAAGRRQRRVRADARPGRHSHRPDVRLTCRLRTDHPYRVTPSIGLWNDARHANCC